MQQYLDNLTQPMVQATYYDCSDIMAGNNPQPKIPAASIPGDIIYQCNKWAETANRQSMEIEHLHGLIAEAKKDKANIEGICMTTQDELMKVTAQFELLKTKAPASHSREFLECRKGIDLALNLVTLKEGKLKEARIPISNVYVERAVWVEEANGEKYLAAVFKFLNTQKEVSLYIPEKILENTGKFLRLLSQYGINLECNLCPSRKAVLWKEYLSRCADGVLKKSVCVGWEKHQTEWHYRLRQNLPWWDRRHETQSTDNKVHEEEMPDVLYKILTDARTSAAVKLLVYVPYLSLIEPVLEGKNLSREKLLNVVVEKMTPIKTAFIQNCLGQKKTWILPMKMKKLREVIASCEEPVFLTKVDADLLSSAEQNLLLKNLALFYRMDAASPFPVIISEKPIAVLEADACVVKIDAITIGASYSFRKTEADFRRFLVEIGSIIEGMVKISDIPEELEEFGSCFERIRVTSKIVKLWLDRTFCTDEAMDGKWIYQFFYHTKLNSDRSGLTEWFLHCFQTAVEKKCIDILDPYTPVTEYAVIVTEDEVYFRKDVMLRILSNGMTGFNELTVLQALLEEGALKTDKSRKRNLKLRRVCTNKNGEVEYVKVIVLKKDEILKNGDFDFLA